MGKKLENIIRVFGIIIVLLLFSVGILIYNNQGLVKKNTELKEENEKLEQNQKPVRDLYNESNKPCAGC